MARVGGEPGPRPQGPRDDAPQSTRSGASGPAAQADKTGREKEVQASAAGADETPATEADDGELTETPTDDGQATNPAAPPIDALVVAVAEIAKPAAPADASARAESAGTFAPTRGSAQDAGRGTTLGGAFGIEPAGDRSAAPAAIDASSPKAAGAAAPTMPGGAGKAVQQETNAVSAVQGAATASEAQRAAADAMPSDNSGTANALRALLTSAASANEQVRPRSPDNRSAAAQAVSAVPPQRAPIAEALAAMTAQSGGETFPPAAHEQYFARLLDSHALTASRAEVAQQVVPFVHLPAASTIAATETVATPVGQPGFAQDLSHRVLLLVNGQVKSAELALTPAELGPVRVNIELRGQDASISFAAAAPATRAALEEALPRLREMFTQQGLNLLDANVGAHTGQQGQRAYGRQQSNRSSSRDDRTAVSTVTAAGPLTASSGRSTRLIDVIA
jgi:flagellar hook-length control protein FliK